MDESSYLTANEMAIKYNCSYELISKFARNQNVPFLANKAHTKLYTFTPTYEALFANRKKNRGRSVYSKIFIIQHPNTGDAIIHCFRTYVKAFNYSILNGAFRKTFLTTGREFERYVQKLPPEEKEKLARFIKTPNFSNELLIWKISPDHTETVYIDLKKPIDYKLLVLSFFSHNCQRITVVEQQPHENTEHFCKRIVEADKGEGQISFQKLAPFFAQ